MCSIVSALQEPDSGSAPAAAVRLITEGRSSWRIAMRLLLEAWALQMHLLHGVGSDAKAVEGVMDRLGIAYRRCEPTRAGNADSEDGASSLTSGEHSHHHRKAKHRKGHKKRSKGKHKRNRAASLDAEELLPLDNTSMLHQAAEWELDGVLEPSGRVTCKYPELVDVLVAHTLTSWSRQLERR